MDEKGGMSIIVLVIILSFLGFIGWLVNSKAPNMNATFKTIINVALVVAAIIIALSAFGVWQQVKDVQVPKL